MSSRKGRSMQVDFRTEKKQGTHVQRAEIALVMGSNSDWPTLSKAAEILDQFDIGYCVRIVSAHRTPERLYHFAKTAEEAGVKIIIAGAGGAAHLPGMLASLTCCPVLGVPIRSKALQGLDSLFSIVQMPAGVPVATFAIGKSGAKNAALSAVSILALTDQALRKRLKAWRDMQTASIGDMPDALKETVQAG